MMHAADIPPDLQERLDALFDEWMAAETREQAALILHGAHETIESLALYEQAVELRDSARDAYEDAIKDAGIELRAGRAPLAGLGA